MRLLGCPDEEVHPTEGFKEILLHFKVILPNGSESVYHGLSVLLDSQVNVFILVVATLYDVASLAKDGLS